MGFILANKSYLGNEWKDDGYYGGGSKYADMFNLVPYKQQAEVIESEEEANKIADYLNKGDWKFKVEPVS